MERVEAEGQAVCQLKLFMFPSSAQPSVGIAQTLRNLLCQATNHP
jgi:hypothetical protein